MERTSSASIDLYWIPLGAGGHFVRLNGKIYEWITALLEGRPPADLYHSALIVNNQRGKTVIENAWPIPDHHPETRGVVVEGPVFARPFGHWRVLRYEVRCWPDGEILDAKHAVESTVRIHVDEATTEQLVRLVRETPRHTWGRDEIHAGEMWNSNSVISWILTRAGIDTARLRPPGSGRAPGWRAGIWAARRPSRRNDGRVPPGRRSYSWKSSTDVKP